MFTRLCISNSSWFHVSKLFHFFLEDTNLSVQSQGDTSHQRLHSLWLEPTSSIHIPSNSLIAAKESPTISMEIALQVKYTAVQKSKKRNHSPSGSKPFVGKTEFNPKGEKDVNKPDVIYQVIRKMISTLTLDITLDLVKRHYLSPLLYKCSCILGFLREVC